MSAQGQPGFDGDTFGLEEIRDHDGKGKRELVRRIRYDVIHRLYKTKVGPIPNGMDTRQGLLDLHQFEAANKLQVDDQLAKTPAMARAGSLHTGKSDFGIADAICAASGRVERAKRLLGLQWPLVQLMVLNNQNIGNAARLLRADPRRILFMLRAGLDVLADFYGTR